MAYFTRILSPNPGPVDVRILAAVVVGLECRLTCDTDGMEWQETEVQNAAGDILFVLERNQVFEGSLAKEELLEFDAQIADFLPKSGMEWLRNYLPAVKTIYSFQLLEAIESGNGWVCFNELKNTLWKAVGGIFQADGEGFSNEDGYHILWQFSDHVDGDWWMAVLQDGAWQNFRMNLGDLSHREAFMRGEVPPGVQRAP